MKMSSLDNILDLVFVHNKIYIKQLLQSLGQPVSGSKREYRDLLKHLVSRKLLTEENLIEFLNQIEGWGDQHIYAFKPLSREIRRSWKDSSFIEKTLKAAGVHDLLKKSRPLLLPEDTTLSSIEVDKDRIRFIWTSKHVWEERVEEQDKINKNTGMAFKAFRIKEQRAVFAFDLDLITGESMLLISRVPNNSNSIYEDIKHQLTTDLKPIIDISSLQPIDLRTAFAKVEVSDEVRARQSEEQTPRGSRAKFTSSNRKEGIDKDSAIVSARSVIKGTSQTYMGNLYWNVEKSNGNLGSEVHTILHCKDNRIAIYGERHETEVRYILGRLRFFAQ